MNRDNNDRLAQYKFQGMATGAFLFIVGFFFTIWSGGLSSPFTLPLMIVGICIPLVLSRMEDEQTLAQRARERHKEARRQSRLRSDRTARYEITTSGYQPSYR